MSSLRAQKHVFLQKQRTHDLSGPIRSLHPTHSPHSYTPFLTSNWKLSAQRERVGDFAFLFSHGRAIFLAKGSRSHCGCFGERTLFTRVALLFFSAPNPFDICLGHALADCSIDLEIDNDQDANVKITLFDVTGGSCSRTQSNIVASGSPLPFSFPLSEFVGACNHLMITGMQIDATGDLALDLTISILKSCLPCMLCFVFSCCGEVLRCYAARGDVFLVCFFLNWSMSFSFLQAVAK